MKISERNHDMEHEQSAERGQETPLAAYQEKRLQIFQRNPAAVAFRLNGKAQELAQRYYKDYRDYAMFHILVGDSPPSTATKFDFPDEDSVANFLAELDREFPGEAQN